MLSNYSSYDGVVWVTESVYLLVKFCSSNTQDC